MKEILEKLDQVMQQFYDKKKENDILFNANKMEESVLKERKLFLSQKRSNERKAIKKQLETIKNKKMSLISEQVPSMDNFEKSCITRGYKRVLLDKKEEELISKINDINEKEQEFETLKTELKKIQNDKNSIMKPFMLGITEYDSMLSDSFNEEYLNVENKIISKINSLKEQLVEKEQLEQELENLRLNKDSKISETSIIDTLYGQLDYDQNLNFKVKGIKNRKYGSQKNKLEEKTTNEEISKSFILDSITRLYDKLEEKYEKRIKMLLKKTDEEKQIEKKCKEIEKRPNYDKVYSREMFELKYELQKVITPEKTRVEILLKTKGKERQNIISETEKIKFEKVEKLNEIEKEIDLLAEEFKSLKNQLDDNICVVNEEFRTALLNKLNFTKEQRLNIKNEISQITVDTKDLDFEISNLENALNIINNYLKLLEINDNEKNAYFTQLNEIEQMEYDRRVLEKSKKVAEQKEIERLTMEQQRLEEQQKELMLKMQKEQEERERKLKEQQDLESFLNNIKKQRKESEKKSKYIDEIMGEIDITSAENTKTKFEPSKVVIEKPIQIIEEPIKTVEEPVRVVEEPIEEIEEQQLEISEDSLNPVYNIEPTSTIDEEPSIEDKGEVISTIDNEDLSLADEQSKDFENELKEIFDISEEIEQIFKTKNYESESTIKQEDYVPNVIEDDVILYVKKNKKNNRTNLIKEDSKKNKSIKELIADFEEPLDLDEIDFSFEDYEIETKSKQKCKKIN